MDRRHGMREDAVSGIFQGVGLLTADFRVLGGGDLKWISQVQSTFNRDFHALTLSCSRFILLFHYWSSQRASPQLELPQTAIGRSVGGTEVERTCVSSFLASRRPYVLP